jgi:hypothetical protein
MKTKSILIALLSLSILFTSCQKNDDVKPSSNVTTISKSIDGYSQLNVSDPFKVYVTFSDSEESIEIEANANLHQYIHVERQNDQLVIYIEDNVTIHSGKTVLNVYITTNRLDAFYGAGAAMIKLQNELIATNVAVNLTGASAFSGTLHIDHLNANIEGASNLYLEGNTRSFELEATGASNMTDYGFESNTLKADLEGACNAYLTVRQQMEVVARGASNVYYKGDGVVKSQNLTGGSHIQKMD